MNINIDAIIVIIFLAANLLVGLYSSNKRTKSLKEYAIGNGDFNILALTSTVIATWVSGSGFIITLSKTYSEGIYYSIVSSGLIISSFITAIYIVPRMRDCIGSISIAEFMGNLYGTHIRIITAIAGCIGSAGFIGVQFRAIGNIFEHFIGFVEINSVLLAGIIVIIYSAFGGIRAVTHTDVLQCVIFSVALPAIAIIIWYRCGITPNDLYHTLQNPIFDYKQVFNFNNPRLLEIILLMLYFSIPGINPAFYQRIAMGYDVTQVKKAFIISGFALILVKICVSWIAVLIYNVNPSLKSSELLTYIVSNYTYVGLKGIIIIAVMAMSMSTADSYLHASAILLSHDICKPLKINLCSDLLMSKILAIVLGVGSILLALSQNDLLKIVITASSFYTPIVTAPFLLAVFGFCNHVKSVFIGMSTGLLTVIYCFYAHTKIDPIIPATLINAISIVGSNYLVTIIKPVKRLT